MRDVAVLGVGCTAFGKFPEKPVEEMGKEAARAAFEDAGIDRNEVGIAYVSSLFGGVVPGQRILKDLGITGIEVFNVENTAAGGGTAFRGVWHAVASGLHDFGLVVGVESMTTSPLYGRLIPPEEGDLHGLYGHNMPAHFAFAMRRHMEKYGTTLEQFAKVSQKNHHNGCLNPYAQYRQELTVEEILNSRTICDPITLLQCCPQSDGAAAALLGPMDMSRPLKSKPISVAASVFKMGGFESKWNDFAISDLSISCAKEAYEMAGCGPEDIDVCEVHDAFAYGELAHYEELGFCPPGEGGRLIDEDFTEIGGRVAVNPSGGLLARGHPISATGVAQIAEIVWQLRGEAGARQQPDAKIGLAHIVGGEVADLECGACAIHIFKG